MTRWISISAIAFTGLLQFGALAETVYIRDTLYVPLRGGQSVEHRILHRGLKSGTKLERLEINEETGFSRVVTSDGMEGWLQSQYLVEEPIAGTQLETIRGRLEELEAEHQQALLRLREAAESNNQISTDTAELSEENTSLIQELEKLTTLAANTISIDQENQRLVDESASLQQRINELSETNDSLQNQQAQEWFLRGAGTILIGLLFGFWIGRRIYNRRNTSGWS